VLVAKDLLALGDADVRQLPLVTRLQNIVFDGYQTLSPRLWQPGASNRPSMVMLMIMVVMTTSTPITTDPGSTSAIIDIPCRQDPLGAEGRRTCRLPSPHGLEPYPPKPSALLRI